MSIDQDIQNARTSGQIRCQTLEQPISDPMAVANIYDLKADPSLYAEIDEASARYLVKHVLQQDLAYGSEIMLEAKAEELASRFIDQFTGSQPRYFTNGSFHDPNAGRSWNSATNATFDTGVIVLSEDRCGCLWVEDED